MNPRRDFARLCSVAALAATSTLLALPQAQAQTFPSQPVRLIVPLTPGSGADIVARALAQQLQTMWGQSVVIENRPGAGGQIGTREVVRAAPDGHTLLIQSASHAAELPALQALAVPVVFCHFGYLGIGQGAQSPGFEALLQLLGSGRAWVKRTGPYRLTQAPLPYAECDALAQALVAAAPRRLVWGSDWPHVMLRGAMPNDADLVDLVARWPPQETLRRQVLVDNPAALYGYGG